MSVPVRIERRYYPTDLRAGYATNGVGDTSAELRRVGDELGERASATVRESQPALLAAVWSIPIDVADWDGEAAKPISPETQTAAIQLVCALPAGLPPPTISPEATGEISFEWYRDNRHVAVLTVQDNIIRWSALVGTGAPLYGREFFSRTVPGAALLAIQDVVD